MNRLIKRGDFEVYVRTHALLRAVQRGIDWGLVRDTVYTGEFKRFGNDGINIEKRFSFGKIICVGIVFQPGKMKIVTIEKGW